MNIKSWVEYVDFVEFFDCFYLLIQNRRESDNQGISPIYDVKCAAPIMKQWRVNVIQIYVASFKL